VGERVLEAEWTAPLGYAPQVRPGTEEHNARNGKGQKTGQTATGPLDLATPRDRQGRCAPQLVPTRPRRLAGFAAQVLSRDARGLSTRASQGHLEERSGTEGSPTLLATLTAAGLEDVRPWPARPLASGSPLRSCEAVFGKARQEGPVPTTAVDLALGVPMDGEQELLGVGLRESAGATCGRSVLSARKQRGVQDGFLAGGDGRTGLPEASESVCPQTQGPLGIVPKVRNSRRDVPWRERRAGAAA
jgi:putative transposase